MVNRCTLHFEVDNSKLLINFERKFKSRILLVNFALNFVRVFFFYNHKRIIFSCQ